MSISYQNLLHPQLLSETTLIDILKSKCIDVPNINVLKKVDLIEIFKRVAFPMPQRQCNEGRHVSKKLNSIRILRKIAIATEEEHDLSAIFNKEESEKKSNCETKMQCSMDTIQLPEVTPISKPSCEKNGSLQNGLKRKIKHENVVIPTKIPKHQKIMWP